MNGKEKKSRAGKSARTKGHNFERYLVNLLIELGYQAASSRAASRELDNQGVDIYTDAPFNIQAKAVEKLSPGVHDIIKAMNKSAPNKKRPNVVAWKRNNKGIVIAMDLEAFLSIALPRRSGGLTEEELGLPGSPAGGNQASE